MFNESIFLSNLGDFLSFTELGPPDKIIPDRFLFSKNFKPDSSRKDSAEIFIIAREFIK